MKIKHFKDWKDQTKVFLFRIWLAGAIAFFIGWTPLGGGENPNAFFVYQLIFTLALGLFITNMLIMGPVKKMMFNLPNKNRYQAPLFRRIIANILHFMAMVLIVVMIWLSYAGVNQVFGFFGIYGPNGLPFIAFEPFTFAALYGLFFAIGERIYNKMLGLKVVTDGAKDNNHKES